MTIVTHWRTTLTEAIALAQAPDAEGVRARTEAALKREIGAVEVRFLLLADPGLTALPALSAVEPQALLEPLTRLKAASATLAGPAVRPGANQAERALLDALEAQVLLPMVSAVEFVGVIGLVGPESLAELEEDRLALLEFVASQAATALQHLRFTQQLADHQRQLDRKVLDLKNLFAIASELNSSLNTGTIAKVLLFNALGLATVTRGAVALFEGDDQTVLASRGLPPGSALTPPTFDPETPEVQTEAGELYLGMVTRGRPFGFLMLGARALGPYQPDEIEYLRVIVDQAAVGLENAKLHEHTQRTAEHLRQMLEREQKALREKGAMAEDMRKTFDSLIEALATSVDEKHALTSSHTERVTEYAVMLAERLGLPESEVECIRVAGVLHDVGKISTPDAILTKPGSFTDEEFAIMKGHVVSTRRILDRIYFPPHQQHIPAIAAGHHEKWNGKGYPLGLSGHEIPLGARILALADVFDALTADRDYRKAMTIDQALEIIRKGHGEHFDPELCPIFIAMIESIFADKIAAQRAAAPSEIQEKVS